MKDETPLETFINHLKQSTFGDMKEVKERTCVCCRKEVDLGTLPKIDQREFNILKLCPKCFDNCFQWGEDC